MTELIFKLFKWCVSMSAIIGGLAAIQAFSHTQDMKYVAAIVLCLAFVFWLSKSTYEASKTVMAWGFGVLVVAGAVSRFGLPYADVYLDIEMGAYAVWWLLTLAIGVPTMSYAFKKDK